MQDVRIGYKGYMEDKGCKGYEGYKDIKGYGVHLNRWIMQYESFHWLGHHGL